MLTEQTVEAIYENGVLRLLSKVILPEGQRVKVKISFEREVTEEEQQKALQEIRALLESWRNAAGEEAEDQIETGEYLQQVLDEDRMSERKLFP